MHHHGAGHTDHRFAPGREFRLCRRRHYTEQLSRSRTDIRTKGEVHNVLRNGLFTPAIAKINEASLLSNGKLNLNSIAAFHQFINEKYN